MSDSTSAPGRCAVCGDPIRPDNAAGICADSAKPDCVRARKREYRNRNPIPYEPRPKTKQCEICGKPLNANNQSGLCNGNDSPPCKARRNKLAYEAQWPPKEAGAQRFASPYIAAGSVFGRLTVLEDVRRSTDKAHCRCECEGRDVVIAAPQALKAGRTRSCGCVRREMKTTHGLSKHPLYKTWNGMLQRCENPSAPSYENYSEHRITICAQWHDIAVFIADILREIGPRPEGRSASGAPVYTLDRIDNDLGYQPGNVRWSTQSQQVINQRKVRALTREIAALRAQIVALGGQLPAV